MYTLGRHMTAVFSAAATLWWKMWIHWIVSQIGKLKWSRALAEKIRCFTYLVEISQGFIIWKWALWYLVVFCEGRDQKKGENIVTNILFS